MRKQKFNRPWGLLPSDVKQLILKREWHNDAGLKARLLDRKPFPIRIGLKPPEGRSAIADMAHFQRFIGEWRSYSYQNFIQWESRSYRALSEQTVPKSFVLNSVKELIEFVGDEAIHRSQVWTTNMSPLLNVNADIYPALVKHLGTIEQMSASDAVLLTNLTGQLSPNMGVGQYLRALPLVGVDTKFLENYQVLIADVLDVLHGDKVSNAGGLLAWLGCLKNPSGWLTVRPLCESVKAKTGGFPVLQLPGDVLNQQELPATNILVVENMQSGLGLPPLPDTIAVFGGGKNVSWMTADWLKTKRVCYWGDLDTWGLSILSDVRSKLSAVTPLMMDIETLHLYEERMVIEPAPVENCPGFLTEPEEQIFYGLKSGAFQGSRLEQERLSPDYILDKLKAWVSAE